MGISCSGGVLGPAVEDDRGLRKFLSMIVERMGHVVLPAADGLEALRLAERERPDLGIIDIGLPGIDGVELTRRIKSTPHLGEVPLVAMTGGARGPEAVKAGCCAFLEKPFWPRQMIATIESVAEKKRPNAR